MAKRRPAGEEVVSLRALNRATLARQLLLERSTMGALPGIEHLVGLQGQAPNPPYIGLWARLAGFRFDQLATLLDERRAVRTAFMRATLHIVSAKDMLEMRPLLQPVFARGLEASWGRYLEGLDLAAVCAYGRELLAEAPRTNADLGRLLAERWRGRDGHALAQVIRNLEALIHVPPAGAWDYNRSAALTLPETWLGRGLDTADVAAAAETMVLRYLAAFGPATSADIAKWSGLAGMTSLVARVRPRLRVLHLEDGAELLDLADMSVPPENTPAPVRLLPEWDNILLAYAGRTRARILAEEHRARVFTNNGLIRATVLIDGVVGGTWRMARTATTATIHIEPFASLGSTVGEAVEDEARRLLSEAAPGYDQAITFLMSE